MPMICMTLRWYKDCPKRSHWNASAYRDRASQLNVTWSERLRTLEFRVYIGFLGFGVGLKAEAYTTIAICLQWLAASKWPTRLRLLTAAAYCLLMILHAKTR